jgi:hypothetical protein
VDRIAAWRSVNFTKYSNHWKGLHRLCGFLDFQSHIFQSSRHLNVPKSSVLNTSLLNPHKIFLVLITATASVDHSLSAAGRITSIEIPATPSGNKTTTFRL